MRSFNEVNGSAIHAPFIICQERRIHHDRRKRERKILAHFLVDRVVVIFLLKRIKLFMPPVHLLVIEVPYARCNIVRFHSSGNELPLIDNEVRVVIVEVIEMIVNDLPIELSDCVVIR